MCLQAKRQKRDEKRKKQKTKDAARAKPNFYEVKEGEDLNPGEVGHGVCVCPMPCSVHCPSRPLLAFPPGQPRRNRASIDENNTNFSLQTKGRNSGNAFRTVLSFIILRTAPLRATCPTRLLVARQPPGAPRQLRVLGHG